MSAEDHTLLLDFLNLQDRIHRRLTGALTVHGLSVSEYRVLDRLANAPNEAMRRVDLAADVGLTPSGVARMLAPMQKMRCLRSKSIKLF